MAKEKEDIKMMVFLSYLFGWLTGLIMYLVSKDKTVRFHAFRSILLFGVGYLIALVLAIIPILGWLLAVLIDLVLFVTWVYVLIKSLTENGEKFEIPVLSQYVDKMAEEWANK